MRPCSSTMLSTLSVAICVTRTSCGRRCARPVLPQCVGSFKLNHNHFPIQDFYICQVVKKADGVITQELQDIAFKDHADAYHEQCNMRW